DRTNIAGAATLAGTVQAVFAAGSYVTRNYTILSAAGGRSGTFSALTTANLPAGFSASLSYTATDATLNLTAALGALPLLGVPNARGGSGAPACAFNINQCNVARRQPRQCAHAALGRSGDRRAAGRVPTHQPVPRHHARSVRRRPQRVRRRRQRRDRLCAGARSASRRHRACLFQGAQGPAQAGELRRALERVGCRLWRRQPHV